MKKNIVLSIVLSCCAINVFGMEKRSQSRHHNRYQGRNKNGYSNKFPNKYTHKLVVKLSGTPLVTTSKETFKLVVKLSVIAPIIVTKKTFGNPESTKMLIAHWNESLKAGHTDGHRVAAQENDLYHSVNEEIFVNHMFKNL